jgi:DNA-binding CsgD family transcriptional regulator
LVQGYLSPTAVPLDPLSGRERQVLQLIAEGNNTKEIGGLLCISAKTAETHRRRIMEKLNISSVAGLVRYAIRRGLIVEPAEAAASLALGPWERDASAAD